jgi:hypothetical protein
VAKRASEMLWFLNFQFYNYQFFRQRADPPAGGQSNLNV